VRHLQSLVAYYASAVEKDIYIDGARAPFFLSFPAQFLLDVIYFFEQFARIEGGVDHDYLVQVRLLVRFTPGLCPYSLLLRAILPIVLCTAMEAARTYSRRSPMLLPMDKYTLIYFLGAIGGTLGAAFSAGAAALLSFSGLCTGRSFFIAPISEPQK
jgi:hypothetical protein